MWRELQVVVDRGAIPQLSDRLFSAGAQGLEEAFLPGEAPPPRQPWDGGPAAPLPSRALIKAWFEDPDEAAVLALVQSLCTSPPSWHGVEEVDYQAAFEDSFQPTVLSPRITIAPPWNAPAGTLIIEPSQGFGTGEHPSTRGAVRALDRLADHATSALDVGSGSGILALAAARLGLRARGIDVEEAACRNAMINAQHNHLDVIFDTTPIEQVQGSYDLVLANLHAELLERLAPHLLRLTQHTLVTAGVLADREQRVVQAFAPTLIPAHRDVDGEWVCTTWTRRDTP